MVKSVIGDFRMKIFESVIISIIAGLITGFMVSIYFKILEWRTNAIKYVQAVAHNLRSISAYSHLVKGEYDLLKIMDLCDQEMPFKHKSYTIFYNKEQKKLFDDTITIKFEIMEVANDLYIAKMNKEEDKIRLLEKKVREEGKKLWEFASKFDWK